MLDKRLTGLQTMGAETVVELYLNVPNTTKQDLQNESNKNSGKINRIQDQDQNRIKHFKEEPPLNMPDTIFEKHHTSNQNNVIPSVSTNILTKNVQTETNNLDNKPPNADEFIKETPPIATVIKPPATINKIQLQPKPNLVKCLDSNGKVIIVQLITDPNNPKNIKIIKNPKFNLQPIQPQSNSIKIPTSSTVVSPAQVNSTAKISSQIIGNTSNNKMIVLNNSLEKKSKKENDIVSNQANISPVAPIAIQPILSSVKPIPTINQHQLKNLNTSNASNQKILLKNGKIIIVKNVNSMKNSIRPVVTIQKSNQKQESLLKPQISLLKTNYVTKKMPTIASTSLPIMPPPSYQKRLEIQFLQNHKFTNIKTAVIWLLKHIPIFNQSPISDVNYEAEFPFICQSKDSFMALTNIQKKCNEWYRAKYIQRLCKKHKKLPNDINKMWTTKEILLFARRLGYTPTIDNNVTNQLNNNELKTIIQSEIKREQLNRDTITLRTRVTDWIVNREKVHEATQLNNDHYDDRDNLLINIDECDDNKIEKSKTNVCVEQQIPRKNMQWLQLDNNISKECIWVTDICRDIQIHLAPEEIISGNPFLAVQFCFRF